MEEFSLSPDFMRGLILKTRAIMANAGHTSDDEGNLADDEGPKRSIGYDHDMSSEEVISLIEDLEPDQQAELVALFWIGRGDMEPEEWQEAINLAVERQAGSTADYLLSHPHIAEHWDNALDRLYDGTETVETGEY